MSIMRILKLDITVEISWPASLQMPAFPNITFGFTLMLMKITERMNSIA